MKLVFVAISLFFIVGCGTKLPATQKESSHIYYPPTREELDRKAAAEKSAIKDKEDKKTCYFLEFLAVLQGSPSDIPCDDVLDGLR